MITTGYPLSNPEQVHHYPRLVRFPLELLAAALVGTAAVFLGRAVLQVVWANLGFQNGLLDVMPWLQPLVTWVAVPEQPVSLTLLIWPLIWFALALLVALLVRNSFPMIRTSPRGILVAFGNDWLPVPWEQIKAIKVTEDLGGDRFVLFLETDRHRMTGWHRLYGLLYNLRPVRGFLIASWIEKFDILAKTVIDETDRVARSLQMVTPTALQEAQSSALFRLMLSPGSFFSRRSNTELDMAPPPDPVSAGSRLDSRPLSTLRAGTDPRRTSEVRPFPTTSPVIQQVSGLPATIRGGYPPRITRLLTWGSGLLIVAVVVRYVVLLMQFFALTINDLRALPVFNQLVLLQAQQSAPWWILVAAHLLLVVGLLVALWMRSLLPMIELDAEMFSVRQGASSRRIPWSQVRAIKVTEFSERSQVVLVQTARPLTPLARFTSMLYDGTTAPGVVVTSAVGSFGQMMQRVAQTLGGARADLPATQHDVLQEDASSPLLLTAFQPGPTLDVAVAAIRNDPNSIHLSAGYVQRCVRPMLVLASFPALMLLADLTIWRAVVPGVGLIAAAVVLLIVALLEWPFVCIAAQIIDESTGGGEEGYRPLWLYPAAQLPRVLPLLGALLLTMLGVPVLPFLLWIGAMVWSYMLASKLWHALYQWEGPLLIIGGLLPVIVQLIVLLIYSLAR